MSGTLAANYRYSSNLDASTPMANKVSGKQNDLAHRREAPLVTPTDLGARASKDIAAGMNAILADVFGLYL